ncbi:MAG TPA: hypothetical protein VIK73_02920 [Limnochordales bacterium]
MPRLAETWYFRTTPLERLNRVVQPSWYCDITTERWTGRKALRRTIEHEREHTRSILATLAAHGAGEHRSAGGGAQERRLIGGPDRSYNADGPPWRNGSAADF